MSCEYVIFRSLHNTDKRSTPTRLFVLSSWLPLITAITLSLHISSNSAKTCNACSGFIVCSYTSDTESTKALSMISPRKTTKLSSSSCERIFFSFSFLVFLLPICTSAMPISFRTSFLCQKLTYFSSISPFSLTKQKAGIKPRHYSQKTTTIM